MAGNNWGICADGTGALGCGPQEEFRACADVTVGMNTIESYNSYRFKSCYTFACDFIYRKSSVCTTDFC